MHICEKCKESGANFCIMIYLDNHDESSWREATGPNGIKVKVPHAMKLMDICHKCLMGYSKELVIDNLQPLLNQAALGRTEHTV